jgi:hypothetical protein
MRRSWSCTPACGSALRGSPVVTAPSTCTTRSEQRVVRLRTSPTPSPARATGFPRVVVASRSGRWCMAMRNGTTPQSSSEDSRPSGTDPQQRPTSQLAARRFHRATASETAVWRTWTLTRTGSPTWRQCRVFRHVGPAYAAQNSLPSGSCITHQRPADPSSTSRMRVAPNFSSRVTSSSRPRAHCGRRYAGGSCRTSA